MTDSEAREFLPMRVLVGTLVAVVLLLPLVLVGSGGWLLWQRQTGERVEAEVLGCDLEIGHRRAEEHCTARWTEGGVERTGPIQGSGPQEVGETVTATLHGDQLYSRSVALPLVLVGLGLPLCWLPYAWVRDRVTRRRRRTGVAAGR